MTVIVLDSEKATEAYLRALHRSPRLGAYTHTLREAPRHDCERHPPVSDDLM